MSNDNVHPIFQSILNAAVRWFPCGACNGSGTVSFGFPAYGQIENTGTCGTCHGKGLVEQKS
jgi:DnaJ-class molecular chaperone